MYCFLKSFPCVDVLYLYLIFPMSLSHFKWNSLEGEPIEHPKHSL